jgi:hypothetical protein
MTPQDVIDDLWHRAASAVEECDFEAVLAELQSALQEHGDYLESVSADYLLALPPAIRKRVNRLHEAMAA